MPAKYSQKRSGGVTIELLLLLPVIIAVVAAAIEFALLIAAEQKLEKAAALGARVAAQGGDSEAVNTAVTDSLGGGSWQNVKITARLQDEQNRPLASGNHVEVVASINATDVVPDLLSFIGFSLKDEQLRGRALFRKE